VPVLARGERVERQLDIVAQLLGGARTGGLVVDQLILGLARPRRQMVDAVDAPAQVMGPEAK
jgi:hypothetical protein